MPTTRKWGWAFSRHLPTVSPCSTWPIEERYFRVPVKPSNKSNAEEGELKKNLPVTQTEQAFPEGKYLVSKTDLKGIIASANDAFVEISGFAREELIGKNHNMVRHPDMPQAAFEDLWRTVKGGRPWRGLVKNRCKNGNYYWVDALVVPVMKNGQVDGYMSVRTRPSRDQVHQAEAIYARLSGKDTHLPQPSWWQRISLRTKMVGGLATMLLCQFLMVLAEWFGTGFGMSDAAVGTLVTLLGSIGLVLGIALIVILGKTLEIMGRITGRMNNIAQGILTDRIPMHRVDELGRLNDALVTMQTHLKVMISEIAEAASVVAEGSGQLSGKASQTHDVSHEQADSVARIAAAIEQMSASIGEVSGSATQASEAVEASRQLIGVARQNMDQSLNASRQVVKTVQQAGETMAELFKSIHAIGAITRTIEEISDQTNLLALNAAIEAARAGEAGRGFAVVADEVRKLAERASSQTREITHTVSEIQRVTQHAVSEMENAGSFVAETDAAMATARDGLAQVASNGDAVAIQSRDIASAAKEQNIAADDVAAQAESIVAGVDQTLAAITEIESQTADMRAAAHQLTRLVGHFRYIG